MTRTEMYKDRWQKFQRGQITEQDWHTFCRWYLYTEPVWTEVVKRLAKT